MLSGTPNLATVRSRICLVGEVGDDSRISEAAQVIVFYTYALECVYRASNSTQPSILLYCLCLVVTVLTALHIYLKRSIIEL
jgi:hypothetical protein